MKPFAVILIVLCVALATPLLAQDKPADNKSLALEKAKADKKLIVAENMQLTEGEAKRFWPLYESYQRDLGKINDACSSSWMTTPRAIKRCGCGRK